MGMTMTEKILARHAGRPEVSAGDLLVSQVDLVPDRRLLMSSKK